MANPTPLIVLATLLGPIMIMFVTLAMATDNWLITDVDMTKLTDLDKSMAQKNIGLMKVFHSRKSGLFRQCFTDIEAAYLEDKLNVVSGNCFYISYSIPESEASDNSKAKTYIMQTMLASYVIGMLACIISVIMGFVLCFSRHPKISFGAALTNFIGFFMLIASLNMFHANLYYEGNKDGNNGEIAFQNTWIKRLLLATSNEFGYSYIFAWLGTVLAVFNAILYIAISSSLKKTLSDTSSNSSDQQITLNKPIKMAKTNQLYYDYPMIMGSMYAGGIQPSMVQALPYHSNMTYSNGYFSDSSKMTS